MCRKVLLTALAATILVEDAAASAAVLAILQQHSVQKLDIPELLDAVEDLQRLLGFGGEEGNEDMTFASALDETRERALAYIDSGITFSALRKS